MHTVLRLWKPIRDGIRRFGLHPPQEETPPDEQYTGGFDFLQRDTDCLVGKPGRRSTIVPD